MLRRIKLRLMMMFKMEMLPAEAFQAEAAENRRSVRAKVDFLDRWLGFIVNASQFVELLII